MKTCLICYKPLERDESDYHGACVHRTFGLKEMPAVDFEEERLIAYAKKLIDANTTITGVQPKLSLWLMKRKHEGLRFTVVDSRSNFIIKPQSETYQALPENEDLCMHLAEIFGIETARHSLIRLQSGALAYITKRFDRKNEYKIASEDLCQLSEKLTEYKYRSSYEQTGKIISQYVTNPGLDILRFFNLVVFSFLVGNADMHLKNFSIFEKQEGQFLLSPAYDLVSTLLVIKNETEQMALTVNGRRNKIIKNDFIAFGSNLSLTDKQMKNSFSNFSKKLKSALWMIENSFLPKDQKTRLSMLLTERVFLLTI